MLTVCGCGAAEAVTVFQCLTLSAPLGSIVFIMFNNLLYLLAVIFMLTTAPETDTPLLPWSWSLAFFIIKLAVYDRLCRRFHARTASSSREYFRAEQHLSIAAIFFFAADLYLLDAGRHLARLPLASDLPVLAHAAGLLLFFVYFAVMWRAALPSYGELFGEKYRPAGFVLSNLGATLPIALPWLLMSLVMDAVRLLPHPGIKEFLASPLGDLAFFLLFFLLLALAFPLLVHRMWQCRPMPAGVLRDRITAFCSRHRVKLQVMLWPLFGGRMLTAGVMGFVSRFRYLLLTPALLEALTFEELEAVLAHEIGHVRLYHMPLYFFLFMGFGILAGHLAYPLPYLFLSSSFFYQLTDFFSMSPDAALSFWGSVPLLFIMLFYFRYVFGFFMRNFERQADCFAFLATREDGSSVGADPLIRSLEKVGWLSGDIRDLPSWHHFGIGQRVDFLEKCRNDPRLLNRHNRKVYGSLLLYLVLLIAALFFLRQPSYDTLKPSVVNRYAEAVVSHKMKQEPANPSWPRMLGDLFQEQGRAGEAVAAYEKALALAPANPTILNNLAWVLLADRDGNPAAPEVRDPSRALGLALAASLAGRQGHILDTLAEAYWANGMVRQAVETGREAMALDPENRRYYQKQIQKFMSRDYPRSPAHTGLRQESF